MKAWRRRFLRLAASAAALPILAREAAAQAYPSRPLTKAEIDKWWPIVKAAGVKAE